MKDSEVLTMSHSRGCMYFVCFMFTSGGVFTERVCDMRAG